MVKRRITFMSIIILSFVIVFSTQATALADIYGCVGKGGKLKIVGSPSDCKKNESPITFGGTPVNPLPNFEGELCGVYTVTDWSSGPPDVEIPFDVPIKMKITNLGNGLYLVNNRSLGDLPEAGIGSAEYIADDDVIAMTIASSGLSIRGEGDDTWKEVGANLIRVVLDPTTLNGTATVIGTWIFDAFAPSGREYESAIEYSEGTVTLAQFGCKWTGY